MNSIHKLLALASWAALLELPALGWRLQGWWDVLAGLIVGALIFHWAHEWEVRGILRREREEKMAGRL